MEHSNIKRKSNKTLWIASGSDTPNGCFWIPGVGESNLGSDSPTMGLWNGFGYSDEKSDTPKRRFWIGVSDTPTSRRIIRHCCVEPQRKMTKPYQMSSKNHKIWSIASLQHHGHPPTRITQKYLVNHQKFQILERNLGQEQTERE